MVWIKGNGLPLTHYKNILVMLVVGTITITGFSAGTLTIIGMVNKKK